MAEHGFDRENAMEAKQRSSIEKAREVFPAQFNKIDTLLGTAVDRDQALFQAKVENLATELAQVLEFFPEDSEDRRVMLEKWEEEHVAILTQWKL